MSTHLSDVWFKVTELEVVSGSGCTVTTADGGEYLDFTSGIAVTSTGHCHPKVVAAIREQAGLFIHAQVNVYRHPLLEQLATRLDPGTLGRWRAERARRRTAAVSRVLRLRLCLPHAEAAEVAAVCRIDGRVRALAARFERHGQAWTCTLLQLV